MLPKKILFTLPRAPGDTVAMTALIRDLKRARPDIELRVRATGDDQLLAYSPYLGGNNTGDLRDFTEHRCDYRPGLDGCKLGMALTYLEEYHRDLFRKYDEKIPLTEPRPDLHLSDKEKTERPLAGRYWVVNAGHKSDMTVKGWSGKGYQQVVDWLNGKGLLAAQVGCTDISDRLKHFNHQLTGAVDLVGKTSLRQLMHLIYHADGVVCGPTMSMLIAAAFWRPCVCIAGGRENWTWLAFSRDNPAWGDLAEKIVVPHRLLHTIGQLDCCQSRGCYTAQVIQPHRDSQFPDNFLCKRPVTKPGETPLPECMARISAEGVCAAIDSYYTNGTLPPLDGRG